MYKRQIIEVLKDVRKLKNDLSFRIIDTHIHPIDVMGVVHYEEIVDECCHEDYLSPGILEKFNYSKLEKIGSRLYFKLFPRSVFSMIEHTYKKTNADRILEEMEASLADKSILLSLDPWAPTENVGKKYSQDTRFMLLGSVDIHNINLSEIESTIKSYVDNYHIVGLKFHPNLQNFKPEPYKNGDEIAKKLRKIYETAAKYKLYVLFHGGISNYTLKINRKYGYIERSRTNGLLENFCDKDGASELLSAYDIKVIIAHIGHYGMVNIDYRLIKKLSDKYSNLFFDTSGVSTSVISRTLNIIPSSKLIFGSDALYNRIAYNIGCVYLAAKKCNNGETSGDIMGNILGRNFVNKFISV